MKLETDKKTALAAAFAAFLAALVLLSALGYPEVAEHLIDAVPLAGLAVAP